MSRKHNFRFYDHDDRGSGSNNIRKVSFKNNYGRIQKSRKGDKGRENIFSKIKIDDDDVDMMGGDLQARLGKRRNFKGRARSPALRQNTLRPSDWYKVKIIYGYKYDRDHILQLLLKHLAPKVFRPVNYSVVGTHAIFYVNEMEAAQLLAESNKKIHLPDGHKMILKVQENAAPPQTPIDADLKEKIKLVMSKRYIAENKALDLSNFVKDPEFSNGIYCPLSRPPVLRAVLQIISENIPDLYALNLTGNKIHTIDDASSVEFQKLKNLKILHLAQNNIKNLAALSCLKGLELTELIVKDNPITQIFSDHAHFIRYDLGITEIRRRFPKLVKLDNAELPPVISFDVGEESKLPTPQASFMCNPDGRGIVREFLSQYFALYDSDKRSDLAQAYHDKAYFSQCAFSNHLQNSTNSRLGAYIQESRNLFKVPYYLKRRSRLHVGKDNIIKYLERLPKTQHDLSSFAVDLSIFTPNLINLSVCGVFREPDTSTAEATWPVRHFSRTFLIVPVGQGFCIVNDSFFITNSTEEQKAAFFKVEVANAELLQSPTSQVTPAVAAAVTPAPPVDEAVRLQMVQTLAAQTGMNIDWSKKCLDETQWNFDRAVWTFTELQKQGAIPPEAFVK